MKSEHSFIHSTFRVNLVEPVRDDEEKRSGNQPYYQTKTLKDIVSFMVSVVSIPTTPSTATTSITTTTTTTIMKDNTNRHDTKSNNTSSLPLLPTSSVPLSLLSLPLSVTRKRRRRSPRLQGSQILADCIVQQKQILFITGAGLSVASGVRPFRGSSGLWTTVIWKTATRQAFRKDPLKWYNEFWLPHFGMDVSQLKPNPGHDAILTLQHLFPSTISLLTQNIDGLHQGPVVECHGRLGLYKCIPDIDSDTDSDNDEDDDRPVHLGHRRKTRLLLQEQKNHCPYQHGQSLTLEQLEPPMIQKALLSNTAILSEPPLCPHCHAPCLPQALLFDEGYHSHMFYNFMEMENMLAKAMVVVFVGTSFAVNITDVALTHAKKQGLMVFNFNNKDTLVPSEMLNVENIMGPSEDTLVTLVQQVQALL